MNYSQIEAFVDLVETKSFSQTAYRLSVSQPAISQRINALEKSLGCQLFERKGDELHVTYTGSYLYEQGKMIISMWKATHLHLQEIKNSPYGNIRIGASTIPSQFYISPVIKAFRNTYPHIQIAVRIAGTEKVVQWLHDGDVDIAIVGSYPENDAALSVFSVAKDHLQLIAPWAHPWSLRQSIELSELQNATLIVREKQSGTRKILEAELEKRGLAIHSMSILGEFGSTDAVIAAVENGLGVSFVSGMAAERAIQLQRVQTIPVNNLAIERDLYCVYKQGHSSVATQKLANFLRSTLEDCSAKSSN